MKKGLTKGFFPLVISFVAIAAAGFIASKSAIISYHRGETGFLVLALLILIVMLPMLICLAINRYNDQSANRVN